jgi:hypothetical protein
MADDVAEIVQFWVHAQGRAYGPYALDQISAFLQEGRIAPNSLVSRSPDGEQIEARQDEALAGLFSKSRPRGVRDANLFIFADVHSGAFDLETELRRLGLVATVAPNLWLLRTRLSSAAVRNTLSQTFKVGDKLLVIDSTRDRLAWFNLGPDIDVSLRAVWNASLPEDAD